jgi:hypothetical protein
VGCLGVDVHGLSVWMLYRNSSLRSLVFGWLVCRKSCKVIVMQWLTAGNQRAVLRTGSLVCVSDGGCQAASLIVRNCLENQACATCSAAKSGFQRVAVRTITLRTVSSFRMQATSASFFGLPAATSRA